MGFDEAIMSDKQERLANVIFWLSLAAGLVLLSQSWDVLYEAELLERELFFSARKEIAELKEKGALLKWIGIVVLVVGPSIHYVLRGKLAPFLKDKTSKDEE